MKKVIVKDSKDLLNIKEYLKDNDFIEVELDDNNHFIAISKDEYESLAGIKDLIHEAQDFDDNQKDSNGNIKIISNGDLINDNLSFEQYEFIKKQINQVIEKTLKPKPEKLN